MRESGIFQILEFCSVVVTSLHNHLTNSLQSAQHFFCLKMISDDHFFGSLDACFIGIDQTSNDPLLWKCEGMQVQHRFELPIPSLAGSVCKYSFSTTIGDIAFSVEYRCKGRPDEKIFGNSRVPSDLEQISGTFKSVREGTLLFIFDNSFSWYNPKILTYKIELFQVFIKSSSVRGHH